LCFIIALVTYTVGLSIYLKITGIYAVATITESTATFDGIDFKYTFLYESKEYFGVFTGLSGHKIGDKYFVSFAENNPNYNLLLYDEAVPDCLKDSFNSYWPKIPNCTNDKR
jgi:hypothetical protein